MIDSVPALGIERLGEHVDAVERAHFHVKPPIRHVVGIGGNKVASYRRQALG